MRPDNSLSFLPPVAYDSGGYTGTFVAVGDVNGDGKLDIVLGNECASSDCLPSGAAVDVLLGNGDGTFQTAVTYGSGGRSGPFWTVSIVIADVNGDRKPDLVVANGGSASVGVLLGNGDGTFQPAVAYGSGAFFPVSVDVADLNGDGKPDIVVANECGPVTCDGSVGVLLGNGDGTFRTVVTYSSGGELGYYVAVADVNGDSKPDLLVANGCYSPPPCEEGAVAVLLGNGDGTFRAAIEYLSGGASPYSLKVADLNADGKLDLVAANSWSGTVGVLLGNGDGTFQTAVTYGSGETRNGAQISSVGVTDVNGDGRPDLLLTTESMGDNGNNGGAVSVLLGKGDGTFDAAVEYASGGYQTLGVAAGDVNGDGKPDLLIANSCRQNDYGCGGPHPTTRGTVTVLLNNSTEGKSTTTTSLVSSLNPSVYGQKVTWTATVTSSGSILPTGKVKFSWSIYTIGTAPVNSSGVAGLTKSNLNADSYPLAAVYIGDTNNLGSTSAVLNQLVQETTSTATLISSPNPSTQGEAVTFTAKISSPTVIPTGPVTLTAGKTVLGTAQLSGGKAKLTISSLPVGSTKVTVTYYGDSNIAKSSASVIQTVQ